MYAMGVSESEFWHMTMRDVNAHIKGYNLKRKREDEQMWTMGLYVQSAVLTATEHVLAGRKARTKYVEKPLLTDLDVDKGQNNKELTEEEKIEKTKQLFMRLKTMQANFELTHKKDDETPEKVLKNPLKSV